MLLSDEYRVLIISVADKIEVMFLSYTLLHFQYVTQKTLKISD